MRILLIFTVDARHGSLTERYYEMNRTQEEVLDSFLGAEGSDYETIRDDDTIDLGTKLLYLERAITQDCETFNQSLDKLYRTDLEGAAERAHLDLIQSFKVINNLCFNNQVQYGDFGVRDALTHYFGSLGEVDADAFRVAIQQRVNTNIATLSQGQENIVQVQKQAREQAEDDIQSQMAWRQKLNLPLGDCCNPKIQALTIKNSLLLNF